MPMITTMVGEVWVDDETDWGDEVAMTALCKEPLEEASNIRVCVRVRPPNQRELALAGGVVVEVGEDQQTVTVTGKVPFVYDVAFPTTIGQLECFSKIGMDIVKTAYNGYNASMFAYGQTSSGKSFSMMGVRGTALVGLIPRIAHLLFTMISLTPEKQFFIEGSFLEIYNEKLRDLLDHKGTDDLKVRESPQLGVHVAGLSRHTVKTSEGVEKIIEDGTGNRTVAATKYNSESSRSHAVFELHCQQKYKDEVTGEEMQSKTKIALIDLAGSERSDKLGSVGKALKEGNNINKSLTVLGRCIKGLVDAANNPKKKINVPFRESVLTWYLRESLAGNARTTMVACCSPAGSNEEETMSTLRYAASAKQIKTSAKKSEDPLKAKVRELAMEVEKLKRQLAEGGADGAGFDNAEEEEVSLMSLIGGANKQKVHGALSGMNADERSEYMKEIEAQMKLLGQDGFAMAQQEADAREEEDEQDEKIPDKLVFPQLSCLNKDEMLSHAMVIPIGNSVEHFMIGRSGGEEENEFELDGMGIQEKHCEITVTQGSKKTEQAQATIVAASKGAQTTLNGVVIAEEEPVALQHMDRVVLGPCRMLCLYLTHPLTAEERNAWTYTKTFREFTSSGAVDQSELMSPARLELVDKLNEIAQNLAQANIIASEMCTTLSFKSQVQMGHEGLSKIETTVDDMLSRNDFRVIISCVAGTKTLKSVEHLGKVASHSKSMEGGAMGAALSAEAALEGDADAHAKLHGHEVGGNWKNRELFEMEAEDFGDLLAGLKATHSNLQSLTGGLADASEGNNIENMVKKIFDGIDMDGSGVIDREELAAAIIRFDRNHDPQFLDRVLEEENLVDMEVDMTYPQFEEFLIRFLQHQFYENLETYVTNKQLFLRLGGRAVTLSAKGEKIFHRKSTISGGGGMDGSGSGNGMDDYGLNDEEDDSAAERQSKGARAAAKAAARAKAEALKKKGMDQMLGLSIEEHKARANKRVSEHARVQYFESVLLTDLKHAAHDLDLLLQSNNKGGRSGAGPLFAGCFGVSAAQKKKAKTDRGIVNALKDVIKNSFRELQILQTATSHSNKHRSELERMVEALLEKQEEDEKQAKYAASGGAAGESSSGSKKDKKKKSGNVGFAGGSDSDDDEKAAPVSGGGQLDL